MANHIFIIYLTTILIFLIDGKSLEEYKNIELFTRSYNLEKYKYIYTLSGVFGGMYIGEFFSYIKKTFNKLFSKIN